MIVGLALLVIAVAVTVLFQWRAEPSVLKRQAKLIEGIERRSEARVIRLVSDSYSDRWGFSKADSVEAVLDVGSQFMTLVINEKSSAITVDGKSATITATLTLSGKPVGPVGNEVTRRINSLKEPFVFTWAKEGVLPGSWYLTSIENPELPEELYGYEPGDIRRAMSSGDLGL